MDNFQACHTCARTRGRIFLMAYIPPRRPSRRCKCWRGSNRDRIARLDGNLVGNPNSRSGNHGFIASRDPSSSWRIKSGASTCAICQRCDLSFCRRMHTWNCNTASWLRLEISQNCHRNYWRFAKSHHRRILVGDSTCQCMGFQYCDRRDDVATWDGSNCDLFQRRKRRFCFFQGHFEFSAGDSLGNCIRSKHRWGDDSSWESTKSDWR